LIEKDEEEEAELAAEISEDSLGSLWDDEDSKVRPQPIGIVPYPKHRYGVIQNKR